MYDAADSILQQKLSQIEGVGQVIVGGGALPAVRVELNPDAAEPAGISLEQRAHRAGQSPTRIVPRASSPTTLRRGRSQHHRSACSRPTQYRPLIVAYHNGAAVRAVRCGQVIDSVENVRTAGLIDGKPAVLVIIFRQPGANIIDTVDRIYAALPSLQLRFPPPST